MRFPTGFILVSHPASYPNRPDPCSEIQLETRFEKDPAFIPQGIPQGNPQHFPNYPAGIPQGIPQTPRRSIFQLFIWIVLSALVFQHRTPQAKYGTFLLRLYQTLPCSYRRCPAHWTNYVWVLLVGLWNSARQIVKGAERVGPRNACGRQCRAPSETWGGN